MSKESPVSALTTSLSRYAESLESLYRRSNRRDFTSRDPVRFLYAYDDTADREVVGLIASCLAYGRVAQILGSVGKVLDVLGPRPAEFLLHTPEVHWRKALAGFKHRFQTGRDVSAMLSGVQRILRRDGSLRASFLKGWKPDDSTVLPALARFVGEITAAAGGHCGHMLPDVASGSACKRLHLYLRWMIRRDAVDVGAWSQVPPSALLVPLDTHMHRIGQALGATRRRQADLRTAMDLTRAFAEVVPDDPVRYDFALARLGILGGGGLEGFLRTCGAKVADA
jgi:uncharacterized protein (TIGR02757 family)